MIECSGYAPLLHAAADLVAPGGRLVLVGVPFGESTVIPLMWVTREIEIIGSIASSVVGLRGLARDARRRPGDRPGRDPPGRRSLRFPRSSRS